MVAVKFDGIGLGITFLAKTGLLKVASLYSLTQHMPGTVFFRMSFLPAAILRLNSFSIPLSCPPFNCRSLHGVIALPGDALSITAYLASTPMAILSSGFGIELGEQLVLLALLTALVSLLCHEASPSWSGHGRLRAAWPFSAF